MFIYSIDVEGLDEQIDLLEAEPQLSRRELSQAMKRSVAVIERNVQPFVPVDRGRLRSSIGSEVTEISDLSIVGRVGSSLRDEVYPKVMELGREPGTYPNMTALAAWVRRVILRGETDEGKIARLTFLIGRSIMLRGIKPREYLKQGWEKSIDRVKDFFSEALENIANGLSNRR